jgi:hypothetical protein
MEKENVPFSGFWLGKIIMGGLEDEKDPLSLD